MSTIRKSSIKAPPLPIITAGAAPAPAPAPVSSSSTTTTTTGQGGPTRSHHHCWPPLLFTNPRRLFVLPGKQQRYPPNRRGGAAILTAYQSTSFVLRLLLILLLLSTLPVLLLQRRNAGGSRLDATYSLSLLLFQPSSDHDLVHEQQQQQQQIQQQHNTQHNQQQLPPPTSDAVEDSASSSSSTAAQSSSLPRLWSYQEIDEVLQCDSQRIVNASIQHLRHRMETARQLAHTNQTVYGTLRDPLFGFFISKTGSNTQEYYHLEALAAIQQLSYTGCDGWLYGCLQSEPYLSSRTCGAVAFGNHFTPRALIPELIKANCTQLTRQWDLEGGAVTAPPSTANVRDVLSKHGVCTIVFRNPLERIVSGFYEWSYRKTTNLTAIEYWKEHGATNFPKPQPQGSFIGMYPFPPNTPGFVATSENQDLDILEAVMTSCVVGITESLTDYVTTLSRILWINPPAPSQSALKARSRERHGMTMKSPANTTGNETDASHGSKNDADELANWLQQFYEEMEAFVRHDTAVWQLARHVAMAQVEAAMTPPHHVPVIPSHLVPRERRNRIEGNCPDCVRCTPSELQRFRWTSYVAAEPPERATAPTTAENAESSGFLRWPLGMSGTLPPEEPPVACIGPGIRHTEVVRGEGDGAPDQLVSRHCCTHAVDT